MWEWILGVTRIHTYPQGFCIMREGFLKEGGPLIHKLLQWINPFETKKKALNKNEGTEGKLSKETLTSSELKEPFPSHGFSCSASSVSSLASPLSPEEKIALFMDLFQGRRDVFPKRWENQKTGKSGYSPACRNEWVKGVCKKPKIKCSDCPNQAFIPVTEQVLRHHFIGEK